MLQVQYDGLAASGVQVGRSLVANWAVAREPRVTRQVVTAGPQDGASELSFINPAGGPTLIWVWTLRPQFRGGDILCACLRAVSFDAQRRSR